MTKQTNYREANLDTPPQFRTSLASEIVTRLQLYSLRTETPMTSWVWKANVAASSIQMRAAGRS